MSHGQRNANDGEDDQDTLLSFASGKGGGLTDLLAGDCCSKLGIALYKEQRHRCPQYQNFIIRA